MFGRLFIAPMARMAWSVITGNARTFCWIPALNEALTNFEKGLAVGFISDGDRAVVPNIPAAPNPDIKASLKTDYSNFEISGTACPAKRPEIIAAL